MVHDGAWTDTILLAAALGIVIAWVARKCDNPVPKILSTVNTVVAPTRKVPGVPNAFMAALRDAVDTSARPLLPPLTPSTGIDAAVLSKVAENVLDRVRKADDSMEWMLVNVDSFCANADAAGSQEIGIAFNIHERTTGVSMKLLAKTIVSTNGAFKVLFLRPWSRDDKPQVDGA